MPDALHAIAGFAAFLRDHGLKIGIAEQQAFIRSVLVLPVDRDRQISAAWRAIACHAAGEWRRWPELFERYWKPQRATGTVRISGQTRPSRDLRQAVQQLRASFDGADPCTTKGSDSALDATGDSDSAGTPRAQGGASRTDALHDRRLTSWLPQDLTQLAQLAERIARRLRRRLTRRRQQHALGPRLDLRRTMRTSLRTGGVPVSPAWHRPRREQSRLFILVDVSRSMETHAQLFLRIARAFIAPARARVFVFHTRLAEVTMLLERDSGAVQEKVNAVTAGFAGGTRIAQSVNDFHRTHARGQLGGRARLWILSDGFDADKPDRLRVELARVRATGARITWFHPTAQRPASNAMRDCAPLIDRFVPLATLRDLSDAAATLH